jgi:UDP-2,3-diacylglucosamine hydrolase
VIIDTHQQRLLVISDLHIGNPFSTASDHLGPLIDYARRERFNLCINGDGFEILQSSFRGLAYDAVGVLQRIRTLLDSGLDVYYIVGNHDILLEHFLSGWSDIHIVPFLNVHSQGQRIRIEHGHLYDPSFVRSPRFYEWMTHMAGPLLHIYPDIYRVWNWYEGVKRRIALWRQPSILQRSVYYEAADMLLRRGFDVVIFGHTHEPLDLRLDPGRYVNSGNWLRGGSFVEINQGRVELKHWVQ